MHFAKFKMCQSQLNWRKKNNFNNKWKCKDYLPQACTRYAWNTESILFDLVSAVLFPINFTDQNENKKKKSFNEGHSDEPRNAIAQKTWFFHF